MPPLWRKMFMGRQPQEWTDLLAAWVDHHSPDAPPEQLGREIESARRVLALVENLLGDR